MGSPCWNKTSVTHSLSLQKEIRSGNLEVLKNTSWPLVTKWYVPTHPRSSIAAFVRHLEGALLLFLPFSAEDLGFSFW